MDDSSKWIGRDFAGRFEIVRLLGEGGMGAVYEARQKFTGRRMALKLIHATLAKSPTAAERFLREAQAPNAIRHPTIVEVLDAGIGDDATPYLAMELLDGEDLAEAVARGELTAAELANVAADVLDALDAAHRSGLVHRDIKPDNVFLSRSSDGRLTVKLLDFGITRQLGETDSKLTGTGTILGTPHYMSPEQAKGEPVDPRTDIWSVGAMLFFALCGRPPFDGANYNLVIVGILTEPTPSLATARPDLPQALCAIVDRAMQKDAALRWPSAREMADALRSVAPAAVGAMAAPAHALAPTLDGNAPPAGSTPPTRGAIGVTRNAAGTVTPPLGEMPGPAAVATETERPAAEVPPPRGRLGLWIAGTALLLAVGAIGIGVLLLPSNTSTPTPGNEGADPATGSGTDIEPAVPDPGPEPVTGDRDVTVGMDVYIERQRIEDIIDQRVREQLERERSGVVEDRTRRRDRLRARKAAEAEAARRAREAELGRCLLECGSTSTRCRMGTEDPAEERTCSRDHGLCNRRCYEGTSN